MASKFLVWKRGTRGPVASIDSNDPRQSIDWKLHEQSMIQIVPLDPPYDGFELGSLIVCFPCPEHSQ